MKRWMGGLMMALALAGCQTTAKVAAPENVRPELAAVMNYEFGQSREPLTVVQDMVVAAANGPDGGAALADELAALLEANATLAAKDFLCRQLAVIGTAAEADDLAALLRDEATAEMARYALQAIPGEAVNLELAKALGANLPDRTKIGIVNTLGVRKAASTAGTLEQISRDHHGDALGDAAKAALAGMTATAP